VYKSQFTFPQIAHNDFAVEQFELLEAQQQNLIKDPESDKQKDEFVQAAEDIAAKLKDRYGDQWINPRDADNQWMKMENKIQDVI